MPRDRISRAGRACRSWALDARAITRHAGLIRPGGAFGYLGWAGEGNLGDDLMYEAHLRLLDPRPVVPVPRVRIETRLGALSRVPGGLRVRGMLLGGGTLFGRTDWWQRVESVRGFSGDVDWMALGVGVEDECFESERRFTDHATMERWVQFAASWPVLGVRGPRSQEILESYGLAAQVTGDPALVFADDAEPTGVRERLLGVSLAVPEARWGDGERSAATLGETLQRLRRSGWRFRFFVFSKWDRTRTVATASGLGESAELFEPTDTRSLLRGLGECHVVLGERLHSIVMACAARTPSVAVEYRPKMRDFMLSIEREHLALRADRLSARDVHEVILDLADARDAEAGHLERTVAGLSSRLRATAASAARLTDAERGSWSLRRSRIRDRALRGRSP